MVTKLIISNTKNNNKDGSTNSTHWLFQHIKDIMFSRLSELQEGKSSSALCGLISLDLNISKLGTARPPNKRLPWWQIGNAS